MKILLVQPQLPEDASHLGKPNNYSTKARSPLPPLGLLYLASYLNVKHDVKVVDMMLEDLKISDIDNIVTKYKPDIVGITSVISTWPSVIQLSERIKKIAKKIVIVVGGPNATQYPKETLHNEFIDVVITGLGQIPLSKVCNSIENGIDLTGIPNCFVKGGSQNNYGVVHNSLDSIDNFPFPDRTSVGFQNYRLPFAPENPSTTMITSMGCPYRCAFCSNVAMTKMHLCTVGNVLAELEQIASLGIKTVFFQDELFTADHVRVREICEGIVDRRLDVWWSVKSRIDKIDGDLPKIMKRAGCFNIHFGIESGNDTTLKIMKKGYDSQRILSAIHSVKSAGLSCSGNFMLAYPGESERDVYATIEFARKLELDLTQFSITQLIPGSDLFAEALHQGIISDDPWRQYTLMPTNPELLTNCANKAFSVEQLNEIMAYAYNSVKTLYDLH
jgi:radical SAM superfamily enzyme YgiQ (UPF0313 family)